jgi:fructose-bisphosphate aldolase class II
MGERFKPVSGRAIFSALKDRGVIVLACNTRITKGVLRGIFRAARDTDSAVIMELAKSECDLKGGYTGLTPGEYAKRTVEAADEVGHDIWALHADHTTVRTGTAEELQDVQTLLAAHVQAGYTSFAIDASYLFNLEGKTLQEQLAKNVEATTRLAKKIESLIGSKEFGLEVEVGEIGKKDASGMVLTSPEEATTYIRELNANGAQPQVLAIANGSTHGNIYDQFGNPIPQVTIDIPLTRRVAQALRDIGSSARLAQHGITGTPLELIATQFPHGDIIKGNVGTQWMNIVWEVLKLYHPETYKKIYDWTIQNYSKPGKRETEIFGNQSKNAIKIFFDEIYAMDQDAESALETSAYYNALTFIRAFKSKGSAQLVREYLKKSVKA